MLGLMCSSCFVKYLLGEIKDNEIDKKDWEQAHQENARQQKTILNSYKWLSQWFILLDVILEFLSDP